MDELINEVLGGFYQPERIHTTHVEPRTNLICDVTFEFPPYERTVQDMGHAGMSQMHEGLVEGLYCVIGNAIRKGAIQKPISFQAFLARRKDALFVRESLTFRRQLREKEPATLTLSITDVQRKMRGKYYAVIVAVQGFLRGEVECWLKNTEM